MSKYSEIVNETVVTNGFNFSKFAAACVNLDSVFIEFCRTYGAKITDIRIITNNTVSGNSYGMNISFETIPNAFEDRNSFEFISKYSGIEIEDYLASRGKGTILIKDVATFK
jgi:hypothetical protein